MSIEIQSPTPESRAGSYRKMTSAASDALGLRPACPITACPVVEPQRPMTSWSVSLKMKPVRRLNDEIVRGTAVVIYSSA